MWVLFAPNFRERVPHLRIVSCGLAPSFGTKIPPQNPPSWVYFVCAYYSPRKSQAMHPPLVVVCADSLLHLAQKSLHKTRPLRCGIVCAYYSPRKSQAMFCHTMRYESIWWLEINRISESDCGGKQVFVFDRFREGVRWCAHYPALGSDVVI